MTLRDAIAMLEKLPETATLFVQRLSGEFQPQSLAMLVEMSDADLDRPVSEVAAKRAPGMEYFLEIEEVRHLVKGCLENYRSGSQTLDQIVPRVFYFQDKYANFIIATLSRRNSLS